jgi:hypothetical protein
VGALARLIIGFPIQQPLGGLLELVRKQIFGAIHRHLSDIVSLLGQLCLSTTSGRELQNGNHQYRRFQNSVAEAGF